MSDKMPHVEPENSAGSRSHKPLPLRIITLNGDGSVYREKSIDLSEEGRLTRLIKHIVWAGHNGKETRIIPNAPIEAV